MNRVRDDTEAPTVSKETAPADAARALARGLSVSTPLPLRPKDAALLEGAKAFRFGRDDSRRAWSIGEGPLVLLVHGWGGRGVQMAPLARALAPAGFRCVVFDAGGHGDSPPEPIGFDTFIRDTAALTEHAKEPVHAWIGHSAGGLGMMAARTLKGVRAERYVCIAAPRFPYVPIDGLRQRTGASEEVLDSVKPILAAQFESDWQSLQAGAAYLPDGVSKLLLAYDIDDARVRHADFERIAERWPGAEVIKTQGYGHNKILQAPQVLDRTRTFLKAGARDG